MNIGVTNATWLLADGDSTPVAPSGRNITPVSLVHHGVVRKDVVESTRAIRAQRDLRLTATRLERPVPLMSHSDNQRPWPVPARPWAMRMRWCDLLFAHWRVEAAALRRLIPSGLELDLFDGQAYVGAVPFTMEGVSPRLVPDVPGLHRFPELNLRTYVKESLLQNAYVFTAS